jgi:hypothetical protein
MTEKKEKLTRDYVQEAYQRIQKATFVGENDLLIFGGAFPADELKRFLTKWEDFSIFQWAMVEEVSQFYVKQVTKPTACLPTPPYVLQQLHLFGRQGHLRLRRDQETILWHFIGDKVEGWPAKLADEFELADYWKHPEATKMRQVEQAYYSWRREFEPRISSDWWPHDMDAAQFTYLVEKEYLDNGRVAFVRYVTFQEKKND